MNHQLRRVGGAGCDLSTVNGRRGWLIGGAGLVASVWLRPALAAPADELQAAVLAYTGGAVPQAGRVKLDVAPLVENGNAVPLTVSVESPMTAAEHVRRIALFNERNPERDIARFQLGPRAGSAVVSTRIRLATSQQLVAVAQLSDGSWWTQRVDVIVTLAACIE